MVGHWLLGCSHGIVVLSVIAMPAVLFIDASIVSLASGSLILVILLIIVAGV